MNLKCSCRISDLSLGFSVFFSMFELTRKTAIAVKSVATHNLVKRDGLKVEDSNLSRIVHGSVLVSGGILAGVSYELVGRPFDVARRAVYLHRVSHPTDTSASAAVRAIASKVKDDGVISFVQAHPVPHRGPVTYKDRVYSVLRVLGRMGPWGAGFLIWEAFGPGLAL